MEIARDRRAGPKRIGELLVAAGVIRQEVLLEALQVAKKSSTPVGRVLMTIGELSERELLAAIEVQSMIRENLISAEFGIRVLNVCIKGRLSLEDSFRRLGYSPPEMKDVVPSGELGSLLVDAGIVTNQILEQCMRQSEENNLPLGRCLVLARAISSHILANALTAQVLVRDGKVTYEQAVAGLAQAMQKQQSIEKSLSDTGAFQVQEGKLKVGELLSKAGLVTESDKVSAIEKGLTEKQPVGQVMVQSGMISPSALDESLKLQQLVNEGSLNTLQAAEILRQANNRGVSVEVIMNEKNNRSDEVDQINKMMLLIRKARLLDDNTLREAETTAGQLQISLGEVIVSRDLIDQKLIDSVLQGQRLVDKGIITNPHLVKVLSACKRSGLNFSDALKQVPPDLEDVGGGHHLDNGGGRSLSDSSSVKTPMPEEKSDDKGFLGGLFGKFKKK